MASRDIHNNLGAVVALNIGAISSNTTTNGAIVDTQGFEAVEFFIQSGTLTDGSYAPTVTEGNASDLSDGSATAAGDLLGTLAGATFAATDDNAVKKIGYKGGKRYVRLNIVSTGVTTGGTLGAVAVKGVARNKPVA